MEKNRQMNAALRSWTKPVLKPGDVVALLQPCTLPDPGHLRTTGTLLSNADKMSRVLLVNRYWTEPEEHPVTYCGLREERILNAKSQRRKRMWTTCGHFVNL